MKALVFNGPRDIRYEDFQDPERTIDNAVVMQVEKCSICGSDLHIYHGDHIGTTNYEADQHKFCVGHEFIGEVVEIGPDVHDLKVGDKVLAAGGTGCGTCSFCRTGQVWKCSRETAFGLSDEMNGGQAEFVQVPNADRTLMRIPDGVSDEQAVLLTDALATASFGINNTGLKPGQSLAVVGLGPIGLLGIELAFLRGASQVFAIDPFAARRAHAEKLGAVAFAPGKEAVGAILEASRGGVHCVFEASGASSAVRSTLPLVKKGGALSFIGLPQPDVALPLNHILYKGLTVRAGIAPVPNLWEPLIPLLQTGRLKAKGLFSHEMDLADGAEAYRIFDAREESVIKIMMNVT
ncbi:alcohol dehydrogenase catalytic domain-containing protein [Congregibacter brevis]|uniref:Alcohol dehydrogenase catalytic domain-containing protein n=1 Tax=Congregibacter brevis TaxID=3081201 RepID=A0ABZ0IGQ0_9GAMM|nr:alcohol dehydrogenase catalytic domain-containing protein [Congregibacter sp. IMCC45268]